MVVCKIANNLLKEVFKMKKIIIISVLFCCFIVGIRGQNCSYLLTQPPNLANMFCVNGCNITLTQPDSACVTPPPYNQVCTMTLTEPIDLTSMICFKSCTITLTEPNALSITCSGVSTNNLGTATANVVGGTPPYLYQWSNGEKSNSISNLSNGNYSVVVTDSNNCMSNTCNLSINNAVNNCNGNPCGTTSIRKL
jgi:SprB repeat